MCAIASTNRFHGNTSTVEFGTKIKRKISISVQEALSYEQVAFCVFVWSSPCWLL